MNKKLNKKGFTIVELVIVIAVIAILAAVLIPTFVSLTRKANIANDTAVAKNLNTAAISAQADTFDEAIEAVKDAGYLLANLNATASDCYFVWDDETNQFLLYDLKEDKIIYSNTDAGDKANWYVAVSDPAKFAEIESAGLKLEKMITDVESLEAAIATGGEFHIDESLVIEEQIKYTGTNPLILDLNGSSLATNEKLTVAPIMADGSVTIKNGTITATGSDESNNGRFNVSVGYNAGATLVVDNVTFRCQTGINGTWTSDGSLSITVKNSTFDVSNNGIAVSAGSPDAIATITDCDITAGNIAILGSQGAKITVDGGDYKGKTVLHCQDENTVITINSGTFDGEFCVYNSGTLIINGGTFTIDPTDYIAEGKTVTCNSDGTWTVK